MTTVIKLLRATLGGFVLAVVLLASPGLAGAQSGEGDYSSQPPPADDDYSRQPAAPEGSGEGGVGPSDDPASGGTEGDDDGALAVTGGDVAQLAAVGGALVLTGGVVLVSRRRSAVAA